MWAENSKRGLCNTFERYNRKQIKNKFSFSLGIILVLGIFKSPAINTPSRI